MAFWRPRTMDSWNIFSKRFWRLGNLFGESDREKVTGAKQAYLGKTHREILLNTVSLDSIKTLHCPLSNKPLVDAVVTPEGGVYERQAIETYLKFHYTAPNSKRYITKDDLYSFLELNEKFGFFNKRQQQFELQKTTYLQRARLAVQDKSYAGYPEVFRCPLSKDLIKKPMLTPAGKLYDFESISVYLETHQTCPKTSEPLALESLIHFDEFEHVLKICPKPALSQAVASSAVAGKELVTSAVGLVSRVGMGAGSLLGSAYGMLFQTKAKDVACNKTKPLPVAQIVEPESPKK